MILRGLRNGTSKDVEMGESDMLLLKHSEQKARLNSFFSRRQPR